MENFFLNPIMVLMVPRPPWTILIAVLIITLEALVLNSYWRNWRLTILVSIFANISSALIVLPFILTIIMSFVPWNVVISSFFLSGFREYPRSVAISILIPFSLIYTIFFFVTVFIEVLVGKVFKTPEERRITIFTVTNLVSYSAILLILIILGIWLGITNQDRDHFIDIFFYKPSIVSTFIFLIQFMIFFGIFLFIFLVLWNKYKFPSESVL